MASIPQRGAPWREGAAPDLRATQLKSPRDSRTSAVPPPPADSDPEVTKLLPSPSSRGSAPSPAAALSAVHVDPAKQCGTCGARFPREVLVCPHDSTRLFDDEPEEDPLLGQILNQSFQVVRVIGEGGMGRVYEARHLRLHERRFALKVLLPEFTQDRELVARFRREAESASSISHPNVVEVVDVFTTPAGSPCIAAEFLDGEELGGFVEKVGRLGVPFAVGVTRQVCRALAAAHERGVVHRDVKPDNVFLLRQSPTERGVPRIKVLDFGVSRVKDHNIHLTQAGVILGTPSFMAPEQARAEVVDERADIYGVGALLYNLLTGARPFDSDEPTKTLIRLLTEELPSVRSVNPAVPPGLEAVIFRAMAKNKEERFSSMVELDTALAAFDPAEQIAPRISSFGPFPPGGLPMFGGQELSTRATVPFETTGPLGVFQHVLGTGPRPDSPLLAHRILRPQVIAFGAGLFAFLAGTVLIGLGGLARVVHDGELSLAESVLFTLFTMGMAVAIAALGAQHVRETIWPDQDKLDRLAQDLRTATLLALLGFTSVWALSRIVCVVLAHEADFTASGAWDLLAFVLTWSLALLGFFLRGLAGKTASARR